MNKEFIPYEEALALNELGFNEECYRVYYLNINRNIILSTGKHNEDIPAPLYQQAFRWFREKYGLQHMVQYFEGKYFSCVRNDSWDADIFDTFEEAELACLRKLIEIAKNK